MEVTTVTNAKARLSALLRRVSQGETILIQKHGRPIARLVPIATGGDVPFEAELTRMEHDGVVRLPALPPDPELLTMSDAPTLDVEGGVLRALLEEREGGR
jgi:prevent-host-death family protein